MRIKLIVGLRNPGDEYSRTRHNVGAWVLQYLAREMGLSWSYKKDFQAELIEFQWQNTTKVLGILPTTFMNLSGQSVAAVSRYYRLLPSEILVVHDDLDLSVGALRCKFGGGHGGHRGLQDVIRHLSSSDFYRLRIGIGHPGDKTQVANYVLMQPGVAEAQKLEAAVLQVLPYLPKIVLGQMAEVMNHLHRESGYGI